MTSVLKHQAMVTNIKNEIKKLYMKDEIPWIIGFSGGKDSTATTQIVVESLVELKKEGRKLNKQVYVISSNTWVETPLIHSRIENSINAMNGMASELILPISAHIVSPKPDQTFFVNIIGRGYPSPNQSFRWCTDRLKIEPANRFIESIVNKFGQAIMVLGVREGESISRDRSISSHSVEGKTLMKHSSMKNTYVFAPIKPFSVDDVWQYLLDNDNPWGSDNLELYRLYSGSSEECPLVVDESIKKSAGSCGNSRFGCWTCTVVSEDKSLTSQILKGEKWLLPLLDFRNWLTSIRDMDHMRMSRRTNGTLYFTKIRSNGHELTVPKKSGRDEIRILNIDGNWVDQFGRIWIMFESENAEQEAKDYIYKTGIDLSEGGLHRIIIRNSLGEYLRLGNGPFTMETRILILRRLLELQASIGSQYTLIRDVELKEIRKLWIEQGDWEDSLPVIYRETTGRDFDFDGLEKLPFSHAEMTLLQQICSRYGFDMNTYHQMIMVARSTWGIYSRKDSIKKLSSIMAKEHLLSDFMVNNDEN